MFQFIVWKSHLIPSCFLYVKAGEVALDGLDFPFEIFISLPSVSNVMARS